MTRLPKMTKEERLKKQREYQRKYSKEYYKTHREEKIEYVRQYRLKHKDKLKKWNRNYYLKNKHKWNINRKKEPSFSDEYKSPKRKVRNICVDCGKPCVGTVRNGYIHLSRCADCMQLYLDREGILHSKEHRREFCKKFRWD